MAAVSWAVLTNVVVLGELFQWTRLEVVYPLPFTVRVKPGLPAFLEIGVRLRMVGSGLCPRTKMLAPKNSARTATKHT
jgi:hypothetical protein